MNIYEIRRSNLRDIIDAYYDGVVLRCANALDMKPPQLHRWLSTNVDCRQNMNETSARLIEQKCSLPIGWMDQRHKLDSYCDQPQNRPVKINEGFRDPTQVKLRGLIEALTPCQRDALLAMIRSFLNQEKQP